MKPQTGARPVYALFQDPDAVQRAVDGLRVAGVSCKRDCGHVIRALRRVYNSSATAIRRHGYTGLPALAAPSGSRSGFGTARHNPERLADCDLWNAGISVVDEYFIIMFELTMLGAILAPRW